MSGRLSVFSPWWIDQSLYSRLLILCASTLSYTASTHTCIRTHVRTYGHTYTLPHHGLNNCITGYTATSQPHNHITRHTTTSRATQQHHQQHSNITNHTITSRATQQHHEIYNHITSHTKTSRATQQHHEPHNITSHTTKPQNFVAYLV